MVELRRISLVGAACALLGLAVPVSSETPKASRPQVQRPRPPAVSIRRPDLQPGQVSIEWNGQRVDGELSQGVPYRIVCAVSSSGFGSTGAWKVGHYLDGTLMYAQEMGPLAAGAGAVSSWSYPPDLQAAGTHAYECVVDVDDAVAEGDEGNNRASASIVFAPACRTDRECESGACVDGVCCEENCQGNCRYCAFPGHVGTCMAVPDGKDPRRACQTSIGGSPACGGACYSGQCAFPDVGTWCGVCAACDGTGRCTATPPDDDRCGVIDCSGLDTSARVYQDLTAGRCAGLGLCKSPNDPATCTIYTDLRR